ncbi:MAG: alkane 1-monooxygenase [Pseudomonadota bacterium]
MTSALQHLTRALPFWVSLTIVPLIILGAVKGGWTLFLVPLYGWGCFPLLDRLTGLDRSSLDPETPDSGIFWYRLITLIWFPVQATVTFGAIYWVTATDHLSGIEQVGLFFGIGVLSGAIGITYAHELIHQRSKLERTLGDLLLASVLYSHFRTEHLLVHHLHVATPKDPVTARYNESFPHFFARVLRDSLASAWETETGRLERRGRQWWDSRNPFWVYGALQGGFLLLAFLIGGWTGVGLFVVQAAVAIWQLELVNYIEHYGLTRRPLGNGRYEHTKPHHSWNATTRATNWLLINLQRHSDHHFKPDRRFPLLKTYDESDAPQLPYGYAVMTTAAMIPPLFRRLMNPRVRAWRRQFYPDVTDWTPAKGA